MNTLRKTTFTTSDVDEQYKGWIDTSKDNHNKWVRPIFQRASLKKWAHPYHVTFHNPGGVPYAIVHMEDSPIMCESTPIPLTSGIYGESYGVGYSLPAEFEFVEVEG